MSKKKPKRKKSKPLTDPTQNTSDDTRSQSGGNTHIRGEVEVSLEPSLIQKYDGYKHDDSARENIGRIISILTLAGVFLAAAFSGWQGQSSKTASDAATRAAKAAEDQGKLAYLEERAWVGPVNPAMKYRRPPRKGEGIPPLTELLSVMVKFTNTGRTPAVNLRIGAKGVIVPDGNAIGPKVTKYDYSVMGNLTPNGVTYKEIKRDEIWPYPFTPENIKSLTSPVPTHRIFVFGKASYNDVINPKITHWFTFAFYMMPSQDEFGVYQEPYSNDIWDEETK
jgi:hypothetical protein